MSQRDCLIQRKFSPSEDHLHKNGKSRDLEYCPSESPDVFHVVNPVKQDWKDLLPAVSSNMGTSGIQVVGFGTCIEKLRQSASNTDDIVENPASSY